MKRYCKDCQYFYFTGRENSWKASDGECRKSPPVNIRQDDGINTMFPMMVSDKDWCGEFDDREYGRR